MFHFYKLHLHSHSMYVSQRPLLSMYLEMVFELFNNAFWVECLHTERSRLKSEVF